MMNTLTFVALVCIAEVWIVWLAYCLGFNNGELVQMENRQRQHFKATVD